MTDMRTFAIYIRLSKEDEIEEWESRTESNSIVSQREYLQEYYRKEFGVKPDTITEYCDDGYTGTNFNRPAFQRMLQDIREDRIQCIIVKDFSRLGRDYIEVGNLLEYIFPLMHVRFISVNDGYDSKERFGTTGGMSVGLQNLIYNMYSRDLSQKVKSAVHSRQRKGEYLSSIRYGYMRDPACRHKLIIDPDAAAVVKRIFLLASEGINAPEICRIFNAEGILTIQEYKREKGVKKTTSKYKKQFWRSEVVNAIIRDQTYLGHTVSHKTANGLATDHKMILLPKEEWIIIENTHEAIVSKEIFDAANEIIRKTSQKHVARPRKEPLFYCGICGRAVVYRNKKYCCRTARYEQDSDCAKITGYLDSIEHPVMEMVIKAASVVDYNATHKKNSPVKSIESEITDLEIALKRIATRKMNEYNRYKDDKMSREEFLLLTSQLRESTDSCNKRIAELREQLEEQSRQEVQKKVSDAERKELLNMEEFDQEKLHTVIDKVILYAPDQMEIIWKYEDWYQEA